MTAVPTRRSYNRFVLRITEENVMPKYVVAARIVPKPAVERGESGLLLTMREPDTWHLVEVDNDGRLSGAHRCGIPTAKVEVRHPVREWQALEPWCPDCERLAGSAARSQAKLEAAELASLDV
jgi:hypothetical protein